jgi:hypothetical protein
MKPRFTIKHQPKRGKYPRYFVSDTEAFHKGENRQSPELYFGDDNILLAAGGSHINYWRPEIEVLKSNHMYAKPTMLIPRGDFGHGDYDKDGLQLDWEWKSGRSVGDAKYDVLLSPGRVWSWWDSKCNVWM